MSYTNLPRTPYKQLQLKIFLKQQILTFEGGFAAMWVRYTLHSVKMCNKVIQKSKHLWKTTSEDAYNFKTKSRRTIQAKLRKVSLSLSSCSKKTSLYLYQGSIGLFK